ncbi:pyrroloquinoline quinone biosynthesis peptide chaperone PqqD [Methylacidimicrobium tartarophylax]|uniref:Coenzyme PQQ synthesis protein D n=1 Tax=Methylacidimicrobium tartarophylax TaxID=1041768 RepID=A0A5E6MED9_9BACT|nr:pyrroloquinoline quinone biosynthesis peptide chaperone PqqD [Methylacidimicrobium tartarophylax]VVM07846.1 Coenzyme PQQ synthesis protein D [Methylacidimicrobium tartarophylax]
MNSRKGTPRLASKARLRWDPVRRKPILLYPEGVLILNPSAEAILSLCDGRRSVAEIVSALADRYAVETVALEADVGNFIQGLVERGLLSFPDAIED